METKDTSANKEHRPDVVGCRITKRRTNVDREPWPSTTVKRTRKTPSKILSVIQEEELPKRRNTLPRQTAKKVIEFARASFLSYTHEEKEAAQVKQLKKP